MRWCHISRSFQIFSSTGESMGKVDELDMGRGGSTISKGRSVNVFADNKRIVSGMKLYVLHIKLCSFCQTMI